MRRCQNCRNEILYEDLQYCEHCGADLRSQAPADDDRLDFEVSECHDDRSENEEPVNRRPLADHLGIQTSAELVQGQTRDTEEPEVSSAGSGNDEAMMKTDGVRRLSPDEVKNIEKNLYGASSSLSNNEKRELMKKMKESGASEVRRPLDPNGELPRPTMAKRGRSIAYFMKNFVQLQGEISLHEEDELVIGERVFVLRKRPLTPKAMIGVAAGVFVVLALVFIPLLVRDAHVGQGEIIGVVLDANHQPLTVGATVRFPESGQTVQTDGEGFFRTGHIAPGTHRIDYVVNDQVVATDYATVAAGDVTTVTLTPGESGGSQTEFSTEPAVESPAEPVISTPVQPQPVKPQAPVQGAAHPTASEFGRITLAANVEGAKFQVDGVILGAGNLTYNRISPGIHPYTVSIDGYQSVTGSVNVRPGQTEVLKVSLEPKVTGQERASSSGYEAAAAALKGGRAEEAIAGFSAVIGQEPSNASAYFGRGEAYALNQNKASAHDDYLRAAEIYRIGGDLGGALTAFNKAVAANPKSTSAYLGRADLYLARHEEIAAIADYESVLKLDKKNAPALVGVGEARFSQGNYKQAIKYFKDARSLDPNNAIIYQYLMLCYLGDDDLKNVRKSYDRFKEVATQEQLVRLHSDREYSAVLRVVQSAE